MLLCGDLYLLNSHSLTKLLKHENYKSFQIFVVLFWPEGEKLSMDLATVSRYFETAPTLLITCSNIYCANCFAQIENLIPLNTAG